MCVVTSAVIASLIIGRESILSLWGGYNEIKLEINYRKISGKSLNTWIINTIFFNNKCCKGTREVRKYF